MQRDARGEAKSSRIAWQRKQSIRKASEPYIMVTLSGGEVFISSRYRIKLLEGTDLKSFPNQCENVDGICAISAELA